MLIKEYNEVGLFLKDYEEQLRKKEAVSQMLLYPAYNSLSPPDLGCERSVGELITYLLLDYLGKNGRCFGTIESHPSSGSRAWSERGNRERQQGQS
jgi:hypothetical protein